MIDAIIRGLARRFSFYGSMLGGFSLALAVAWFKGRRSGQDAYIRKREAEKQRARQHAEEITHETRRASDRDLDRRLSKWLRD